MKLNKNQRKFFKKAVEHFGEGSIDVRLKDLNDFAKENDLIVPTSALKNYCHGKGHVRGHYDLTLTGFKPIIKELPEPKQLKEFKPTEIIVIDDTPAFVSPPKKKEREIFDPEGAKPLHFTNPTYLLMNSDYDPISIHKSPKGAYDNRKLVLHDFGDKDFYEVETELLYTGKSLINSTNSGMWCSIIVMEMKK